MSQIHLTPLPPEFPRGRLPPEELDRLLDHPSPRLPEPDPCACLYLGAVDLTRRLVHQLTDPLLKTAQTIQLLYREVQPPNR